MFRYSNHLFDQETGERLIEQVHFVSSSSSLQPDIGMMGMDGRGGGGMGRQGGREMTMVGNGNGSSSSNSNNRPNQNPPTVLSYQRALMKGQGIAAQGQRLAPGPGLAVPGSIIQQEKEKHRIAKMLLKKQTKLKQKKEKMAVVKQKKKEVRTTPSISLPVLLSTL